MKDTTTGEDIFKRMENSLHKMELPWPKMTSIMKDGSLSMAGKKVGLLKIIRNHVAEVDSNKELIFMHCIIHQEILCQEVIGIKHVVDPIVNILNFIRERGLNHITIYQTS
ncbi:General transcription factor II-I repeat domain-containing protein 2 [Thelohanellus kitauei]|uniref:General transcription factor II-I repeat domain-containing protein 2 n=1 Tax=Thelohanellus kitauei TaxID=669202 RepID=A0A0C2N045_THEKT|nr:General transcription factor II-I repeat domain-containing protein 2 [Thelohanellus kitauei]